MPDKVVFSSFQLTNLQTYSWTDSPEPPFQMFRWWLTWIGALRPPGDDATQLPAFSLRVQTIQGTFGTCHPDQCIDYCIHCMWIGCFNENSAPPESPWHESFFFSAAQSIVFKTILPIWVAFSQTSKNAIHLCNCALYFAKCHCPETHLCIVFGAVFVIPYTHFYLSNIVRDWINLIFISN